MGNEIFSIYVHNLVLGLDSISSHQDLRREEFHHMLRIVWITEV